MAAQQLPQWVVISAALLTPLIAAFGAGFGAFIAWQQWRTNRNKLKFDLFEKRYAFYEAAGLFIDQIQKNGGATDKMMYEFLDRTKTAKFIVGPELAEYFETQLYDKAMELNGLESEYKTLASGPERERNDERQNEIKRIVERQREIKNWLSDQRKVLDKKFAPLLPLSH